jgi:hypothetical protein
MHARELARWKRDTSRTSLPFEWGIEYVGGNGHHDPKQYLHEFVEDALQASDRFFVAPPTDDYTLEDDTLTFPSAVRSPYVENNTVHCRFFPAPARGGAVIVLPQWNADPEGHVALCRLLNHFGITALRLAMPYHEARKPAETARAEYMVSANIGRTIQASHQAVLDARRAADWLVKQGYTKLAILGTSLGSAVAFTCFAHDERFVAGVFNHVSTYFADVVWTGLTTQHVRRSLEGNITLSELRKFWSIISPQPFVYKLKHGKRHCLLISAKYDTSFLPHFSQQVFAEHRRYKVPHEIFLLPCGHYTLGSFPFNYLAGLRMATYLKKRLR